MADEDEAVDFFTSMFPKKGGKNEDRNTKWAAAMISALAGVRDWRELLLAAGGHAIAWFNKGDGPSVLYNTLADIHIHKQRYIYAAVPLFADATDLDLPKDTQVGHAGGLALGYVASYMKFV